MSQPQEVVKEMLYNTHRFFSLESIISLTADKNTFAFAPKAEKTHKLEHRRRKIYYWGSLIFIRPAFDHCLTLPQTHIERRLLIELKHSTRF